MTNKVCLPLPYFMVILSVIIFLILNFSIEYKKPKFISSNNEKEIKLVIQDNKDSDEKIITYAREKIIHDENKELDNRDLSVYHDPMSPPFRRVPRHVYPRRIFKLMINIPTQGHPDSFHYIGNLTRKNDEKIIKLFGRQNHPGSTQWEYYGIGPDGSGTSVKFPITTKHKKELYDGDKIDLELFDLNKGKFTLYLHDYNTPRYNPYDY